MPLRCRARYSRLPLRVAAFRLSSREIVEAAGVLWINDSKATNVAAARVGMAAMTRPTILLLGGRHAGQPYVDLAEPVRKRCKAVLAYGELYTFAVAGDLSAAGRVEPARVRTPEGKLEGVCVTADGVVITSESRDVYFVPAGLTCSSCEMGARAERLKNLLPPKPGGALALLNRRPDMDVVFCGHTGLEGAVQLKDFKGGVLLGKTLKIRFWRVPASDVPAGYEAQTDWLFYWW